MHFASPLTMNYSVTHLSGTLHTCVFRYKWTNMCLYACVHIFVLLLLLCVCVLDRVFKMEMEIKNVNVASSPAAKGAKSTNDFSLLMNSCI